MKLIINADDFGLSKSITDGIVEGIKGNYITSTSIMVNMEYTEYAIKKAIENNIKCIGLHANLTLGKPIIKNENITDEDGYFLYNKFQIENDKLTYDDAYNEIKAQIVKLKELSNNKIRIDHLDTHHYLCKNSNIRKAIIDIANELNVPIRKENEQITAKEVKCPDVFYDNFSIYNIKIEELEKLISNYRNKDIIVEMVTHPGYIDEYTKQITSCLTRDEELKVLKRAKLQGIFEQVDLIDFSKNKIGEI